MKIDDENDDLVRKILKIRDDGKRCIITGKYSNNMVICHLIKRRHMSTRWDLRNVHYGDFNANNREENNEKLYYKHVKNVEKREGAGTYQALLDLKNSGKKPDKQQINEDLKQILKHYNRW